MEIEEMKILLTAHRQALGCIQKCMTEAHRFPLNTVDGWWNEAKAKAHAIEVLEQELEEAEAQ